MYDRRCVGGCCMSIEIGHDSIITNKSLIQLPIYVRMYCGILDRIPSGRGFFSEFPFDFTGTCSPIHGLYYVYSRTVSVCPSSRQFLHRESFDRRRPAPPPIEIIDSSSDSSKTRPPFAVKISPLSQADISVDYLESVQV